MHANFEDQYHPGASILHQADPRAKILLAVGSILLVSLTPIQRWVGVVFILLLIWLSVWLSDLPFTWILKRSVVALPFVLAALPLPFTTHGTLAFTVPLINLQASQEGLVQMAGVFIKSWISVQAAILLAAVTRFDQLLWGLRGLFLPRALIGIIGLMYRYLFLLADEILRLTRARASRSGTVRGSSPPGLIWQAQISGNMAGVLFIRSLERSERIYLAMASRGYKGEPLLLTPLKWRKSDSILLLFGIACLGFCFSLGFWR